MKNIIIIICTLFIFVSCVGIKSEITLKENGSGIIILTYTISQTFKDLANYDDQQKSFPLPVQKIDFQRVTEKNKGLNLESYSLKESEQNDIIEVKISFKSIDLLNEFYNQDDSPINLQISDNKSIFKQIIPKGNEKLYNEDSIAMLKECCFDYAFDYIVNTPKKIINYNIGSLSENKRSVKYNISLYDIITSKESKTIEIIW